MQQFHPERFELPNDPCPQVDIEMFRLQVGEPTNAPSTDQCSYP